MVAKDPLPNDKNFRQQLIPSNIGEMLIGSIHPIDTGNTEQTTNVVIGNASNIREQGSSWANTAIMSLDGLLRPVSKSKGDGNLPQYATNIPGPNNSAPDYAQPPLEYACTGQYDLDITINFLDPLVHPDFQHYGIQDGHDWDIIARHEDLSPADDYHISMVIEKENEYQPYSDDARFMALRGPLVIHGWGYDTNGKPIPNAVDDVLTGEGGTRDGVFTGENLTDRFLPGWLKNSSTWPVAPVDLRFDRKRAVWVSPPSYKLIMAVAEVDIPSDNTGEGYQKEGSTIYDSDGTVIPFNSQNHIIIKSKTGSIFAGETVVCYYNVEEDVYWALSIQKQRTTTTSTRDPSLPSTSSTTSTTTLEPNLCTGECSWEWSGTAWNIRTNFCGLDTGSIDTGVTTTVGPEGTTCEPAGTGEWACCYWTFEPFYELLCDPLTLTGCEEIGGEWHEGLTCAQVDCEIDTGSCECVLPNFCGEETGEIYFSVCSINVPNEPLNCDTGEDTGTTTCNCTGETPTGCDGCTWKWVVFSGGAWGWLKIADMCKESHPNCGGCVFPTGSGGFCDEQTLPCEEVTEVPDPNCFCTGDCVWIWFDFLAGWTRIESTCEEGIAEDGCSCIGPTENGEVDCEIQVFPCITNSSSTTTLDPCAEFCCTSTSSTTLPPETCVDGRCRWRWDGADWILQSDTCPVECPCIEPRQNGKEVGQIIFTICGNRTTTTSTTTTTTTTDPTSTTTTTTTTSTTTTTTLEPCGQCIYDCDAERCAFILRSTTCNQGNCGGCPAIDFPTGPTGCCTEDEIIVFDCPPLLPQ